jgi:hypothetical protein
VDPVHPLRAAPASAPAEEARSYWIAGGSIPRAQADFAVLDDRPRTWSGERVGFRCALGADEMERRLRAGDAGFRDAARARSGETEEPR